MTETTSLPRGIATTVASLPHSAATRHGDKLAARYRVDGEWRELTYAAEVEAIDEVALGLIALGIAPGDRVAIISDTRLEWTVASYGITVAGGVVVPVYPTSAPRECEWVLGNSGSRAVVCENAAQVAKITEVRAALPELTLVVTIEPDAGGDLSLDELRERGRGGDRAVLDERRAAPSPQDPYTIIYTSGTTGPPKGVVLTHRNAMSVCEMVEELKFISAGETTYLYLPLAHGFAQTAQLASFDQGTSIVYYGGDTRQILQELIETKPTYLPSVPRIFEKLYAAAMKLREQGGEEDRARFDQAIAIGVEVRERRLRGEDVPPEMQAGFDAADEQLYAKVRGLFGGQIKQAVTGAAPIAAEILRFFYACGVPVLEGWGMTETTAVGTVATLDHFKFGTVGRAMPGVEVKIAAEDGEILARGPNVFAEYWRNPEATAETLVDGWLHTGDVGEIDADGFLSITGRKKDIIITAGGKNLTPANIENDLKQSALISQAIMHGDRAALSGGADHPRSRGDHPVGEGARPARGPGGAAEHPEVVATIQAELDRANANYAQVEQIKKFAILDRDLSIADGELTPTLKVKRAVVAERYADVLESLYR